MSGEKREGNEGGRNIDAALLDIINGRFDPFGQVDAPTWKALRRMAEKNAGLAVEALDPAATGPVQAMLAKAWTQGFLEGRELMDEADYLRLQGWPA